MEGAVVFSTILIPLLFSIASLSVNKRHLRRGIILFLGFASFAATVTVMLWVPIPGFIRLEGLEHAADKGVIVLDFVLLIYVLWISRKTGQAKVMFFAMMQAALLFYAEFFRHWKVDAPAFYVDELSLVMNLIVSAVGSIIAAFSLDYMDRHEMSHGVVKSRQPRFFAVMTMFMGAMNGLVFSNNLMWVYFFWEVTTVCSFLLISHDYTQEAVQNAVRALWMNMMGGTALLFGIILIYSRLGPVSVSQLMMADGGLLILPVVFMGIAAFTKSAQMPFESWLLGAMVAPTPVSSFLHSSTMVNAGIYLIMRAAPLIKGTYLSSFIAVYGAYTFLATAVLALSQSNAKKILAFSTVSNLGLMMASIGINTANSLAAAMLLLVFHSVSKALVFLCVGAIEQHIGSRDIEDMKGLIKRVPELAFVTVVGILSLMIAPFGMLLSKWLALEAASLHLAVALMMAAGSAVTVMFYSRWVGYILSKVDVKAQVEEETVKAEVPRGMSLPLKTLACLAVLMSLFVSKLFEVFVEPEMDVMHLELGIKAGYGYIGGAVGGFAVMPVFVSIALVVAAALAAMKRPRLYTTPYVCGLGFDEGSGYEVKNYYLKSFFDEKSAERIMDIFSIAMILVIFGRVLL